MNNSKIIKVLHVIPSLDVCGGIQSYVMNYYRYIDRTKVQFDFITHSLGNMSYKDEIKILGGSIYLMPELEFKNIPKFLQQLDGFFKLNYSKYNIIHCHMANAAVFYLSRAQKYNIPIRILHSHQSMGADIISHRLRNYPLNLMGKTYANKNFACSELAGNYLFKNNDFIIINNAIDVKNFLFDNKVREDIRTYLKLNDKFIIGHIGRFNKQKNHMFILNIFKNIVNEYTNSHLILIGDGELKNLVEYEAKKFNILNKINFIGKTNNVNQYLQAFDIFLLPSFYEGLPVVGVEAQAASLKCFFSNRISKEADISGLVKFLPLNSPEKWAKIILKYKNGYTRKNTLDCINKNGYNIKLAVKKLEDFYIKFGDKSI